MGLKNTTDARQFKQLEEELESLSPDFFSYYSQQWQPCKDQWASYLRVNVVIFCNDTNNFVESENAKIGRTLCSSISMASAIDLLHSHGILRANDLIQSLTKESVSHAHYRDVQGDFTAVYTAFFPHAAQHMIKNHQKVDEFLVEDVYGVYLVTGKDGARFKVTVNNGVAACHCPFYLQLTLPCVHLMACSKHGMSTALYSADNRWLKSRSYSGSCQEQIRSAVVQEVVPAERRHCRTEAVLSVLSNSLKSCGGKQFQRRLNVIQEVLSLWEGGCDVEVSARSLDEVPLAPGEEVLLASASNVSQASAVEVEYLEVPEVPRATEVKVDCVEVPEVSRATEVKVDCVEVPEVPRATEVKVDCVEVPEVPLASEVKVHCVEVPEVSLASNVDIPCVFGVGVPVVTDVDVTLLSSTSVNQSKERGKKRAAGVSVSLLEAQSLNVLLPKIRPRGRPAKVKTKSIKCQKARPLLFNEDICYICLKTEGENFKASGAGYNDWTRCILCTRRFHAKCIRDDGQEKDNYICRYH
ncbi:hypothetical protein EGW08_001293 [Elysia chlorotica]|uniref:SWIM-type domain-containing protein n=1 Tax=Elysia chlorotica TaxID=188477 RepID=A0A433UAZ4_ELYCH|nr:hypothetical protein EGW08_001293 [Elysia chlorotica]